MVDWTMGKFTYTLDQDTIHKRYDIIVSQLPLLSLNWRLIDENCLKTPILLFLIIFVAIADGVFLLEKAFRFLFLPNIFAHVKKNHYLRWHLPLGGPLLESTFAQCSPYYCRSDFFEKYGFAAEAYSSTCSYVSKLPTSSRRTYFNR